MIAVQLEREEWDRILAILAEAPWKIANPLLMRIGEQLRAQAGQPGDAHVVNDGEANRRGNSGLNRNS